MTRQFSCLSDALHHHFFPILNLKVFPFQRQAMPRCLLGRGRTPNTESTPIASAAIIVVNSTVPYISWVEVSSGDLCCRKFLHPDQAA